MFDLIREKYEPKRPVEMQEELVGQQPAENNAVFLVPEIKPNYALMALNLVLFICAISLMVYGAIHLNDCPAKTMIAVSYIVMGAIFFISRLLNSRHEFLEAMGQTNVPSKPAVLVWMTVVLQLSLLGWFFATCYWAYSIKPYIDKKNPDSPNYCDAEYYKNVFWGTTLSLVGLGLVIIVTIVAVCYYIRKNAQGNT